MNDPLLPPPAPSPSAPPAALPPERRLIGSRAEMAAAMDALLALRPRMLRIASIDGSHFGLDSRRVMDALLELLRHDHQAHVRVLVDDPAWIETRAARLKLAQRRYPHAIELRVAAVDNPVGEDVIMLADRSHSIDVRAGRLVTGELWLTNAPRAQPLLAGFDRRWDTAAHNLPVSPLGL